MIVSMWDRARLARDSAVEDRGNWAGVTLRYCVGSPQEVRSIACSPRPNPWARPPAPPARPFWGGFPGVFVDPRPPVGGRAQPRVDAPRRRIGRIRRGAAVILATGHRATGKGGAVLRALVAASELTSRRCCRPCKRVRVAVESCGPSGSRNRLPFFCGPRKATPSLARGRSSRHDPYHQFSDRCRPLRGVAD
jgi:hypothetical protein